MIPVGLRIDVDTLRGTRIGVPRLLEILARHEIQATFFFSVGPDNMGRHLWRMAHPAFLAKMLRTRASSLYGWDILLRGTLWPGPVIGAQCPEPMRETARAGHEVGLHAWDHHRWQVRAARMDLGDVTREIERAHTLMTNILGRYPDCAAAPAWRTTPAALEAFERFPFRFNADCRGRSAFRPLIGGRLLDRVQVPTTLPTYDELIGVTCTPATYNGYLLERILPARLNVLTIHAEAEGISCLSLFRDFLDRARRHDMAFMPLGRVLAETEKIGESEILTGAVAGRQGWVSCQAEPT